MAKTWEGRITIGSIVADVEVTIFEETEFEQGEWYGTGVVISGNSGYVFKLMESGYVDTQIGKLCITNPGSPFDFQGSGKFLG